MELKVSSPKPSGLSPSDGESDPEEKEISDEDDDDRNHKHRRRETRSQSLERDSLEQVLSRPYRKRNKPFENGHSFRENDSQSTTFARAPLDLNQRTRMNQSFSGDSGPVRGRGRDPGSWNQRDPRFSQVDIASQMVQGSIPPGLYAGRGLPNVSNTQNASWSGFGLLPGIPNGALDSLHSLGLQGTLRPPLSTSLNKSIPRQRCRDFEERGFCLRGDMCPMEHGVNRIVVEDVQSLSQFNLPVSLPSAHLLGTPAGPGPLPSVNAPPSTLMNSKGFQNKSGKPEVAEDELGLNGAFSGSAVGGGAELYDPDQPLWNNDCPETPSALLALHSPKIDETECLLDANSSDLKNTGTTVGSQSTNVSVWGRIGGAKDRLEAKEKIDSVISSSDYLENEGKEDQEALTSRWQRCICNPPWCDSCFINAVHAIDAPSPTSDHSKPIVTNGPKAPPPLQKKLESLELMKEELRKKQEMLDQKRNDFRRQLDKLEKQATGLKGEVGAEQAAKRPKVGIVGDAAKAATPRCTDPGIAVGSPQTEITMDKNKSAENVVPYSSKTNSAMVLLEPTVLKQSVRPLALGGTPSQMNRYKLDNRPMGFRIMAPLPTGLANVGVLKEHFSSYGDLSTVELEDLEALDGGNGSDASRNCSARIIFTTRRSAERAFVNGKCWQGHNLHFMWLISSNSGNELGWHNCQICTVRVGAYE
ncbi:unnamed protein product, partial [Vitis vinifera]